MSQADPLQRPIRPQDIPLQSPMPRSPILDREEPELSDEPDIPAEQADEE